MLYKIKLTSAYIVQKNNNISICMTTSRTNLRSKMSIQKHRNPNNIIFSYKKKDNKLRDEINLRDGIFNILVAYPTHTRVRVSSISTFLEL